MQTLQMPSTEPQQGIRASRVSPVIIATDGREQSDAALIAGRLFAEDNEALRVVSVLAPMPVVSPEAAIPISPDIEASRRADLKRGVQIQMARAWGGDEIGEVEVYDGDPATTVARLAHESNASG